MFYVKERYLWTTLCLTMLFYTKESGLVAGFVLGVDAIFSFLNKKTPVKLRLYKLLSVGLPCIFIGIFFLVQKHIRGWYILPLYSESISHTFGGFWYLLRIGCIRTVFYDQMRFYYFILLMLLAAVAAIKRKSLKIMAVLLPATCIYYFVDDTRAGRLLPGIPFFVVFILSATYFLYTYSSDQYYTEKQRKLIRLNGWFVLCFLCFSAMNFFTPRYLLAAIVPMLFITAVFSVNLIRQSYSWLFYPVVLVVLAIGACAYIQNSAWGDCEHGMFDALDAQQGVVNYFEKNVGSDEHIGALFMEGQHLSSPATGFLHSDRAFWNVSWDINANTEYAIFDDIENDTRHVQIKNDTSFHLVQRIEKGKVWAEIYKRK